MITLHWIELVLFFVSSFFWGVFVLLGYMIHRMMKNDGWDDSNVSNALRVLSHVTLHAEDFGKMFYLKEVKPTDKGATPTQFMGSDIVYLKRPFWYVDKDEFESVVETRP